MKNLLSKLEALVDEVTLLVREERARRNLPWPYLGSPDLYGPRGTEIHWADKTGCAPPPNFTPCDNWGGNGILDTPKVT